MSREHADKCPAGDNCHLYTAEPDDHCPHCDRWLMDLGRGHGYVAVSPDDFDHDGNYTG